MAIERIQVIYCDPHQAQGEKVEGLHFQIRLNGENLKIDLCEDCEAEYLSGVRELMDLVNKPAAKKSSKKKAGPDPAEVRAWAEQNDIEVKPTGRVPAEVVAAYEAANR